MLFKRIIFCCLSGLLLLSGSCYKNNSENPFIPNPPVGVYGTFRLTLKVQNGIVNFLGQMLDGPNPSNTIWEQVATAGNCRLMKPRIPVCTTSCAGAVCVEDNICQASPMAIDVGTVTLSGAETKTGLKTFSMDPNGIFQYMPKKDFQLKYPPFAEGNLVTLSAAGCSTAAPFSLRAKGISPVELLNDSIWCRDGQPIILRWTPANIKGNSNIFVAIDITYHGGTKASVECDCEDNGELTIAASLLDQLKTYGISGFPKIEITRRAIDIDPATTAKLVIESTIMVYMLIPGIISCSGNGSECPPGQYCATDFRCRDTSEQH